MVCDSFAIGSHVITASRRTSPSVWLLFRGDCSDSRRSRVALERLATYQTPDHDLELTTATLDGAGNPNNGTPNLNRNRIGEVAEVSEQVETIIKEALQEIPFPRLLEALDLAVM
ncbi:hypothetical protein PsorP6_010609 [Peronosclerospora sorghi]|uniref:Uncharacterized protein n=1 Tax=Peronosclerospora sorghi TaxID=230839 RepID=A0ACC0VYF7_9STRA|nr:hypothetical protein PsorP6_010609 [Peronosclerospora sorghi]